MLEISKYSAKSKEQFDKFINEESVNGTFLQTKNFLDYHPKGKFEDATFFVHKSGTKMAAFPGNVSENMDFISHAGSTFGGPIISKNAYSGARVFEILKCADEYLTKNFKRIKLKLTPSIFSVVGPDLIEYVLEHLGYTRHTELSTYLPLYVGENPLKNCDNNRLRNIRKSLNKELIYSALHECDFEKFYELLELSKAKHGVKPVHTLKELLDLKTRLGNCILFRAVYMGSEFVAGLMLFAFYRTNTLHFQYIAENPKFAEISPATCILVNAIREACSSGFSKFSFGISTENGGDYLNENLLYFKESFGAMHCVNVTYTKGTF